MKVKKGYTLFDGRALHDISSAATLEYVGDYSDENIAIRYARSAWAGYDAVLVSHKLDTTGGGKVTEETVVGHIKDL